MHVPRKAIAGGVTKWRYLQEVPGTGMVGLCRAVEWLP
jgi:hypothetical protein